MRSLKTEIKVEIYELNGERIPVGRTENLLVLSHWNHGERITIVFNNQKMTVIADDLTEAIKRCSY